MRRLLLNGDPGIRKGAVIEVDGEEVTCFSISRNGEWHGPDRVQLSCVVGDPSEHQDFQERNFIPHFLDTEAFDADDVTVLERSGTIPV